MSQLKTNPKTTESRRSIDLSWVTHDFDANKEKKKTEYFQLADFSICIKIYPKGCGGVSRPETQFPFGFYFQVESKVKEDTRKIYVEMHCGERSFRMTESVSEFEGDGFGWHSTFKIEEIKKNPIIDLTLRLIHNDYPPVSQQFEEQLDNLYDLCCKEGDLTLKIADVAKEDEESLQSPPRKKRKLNDGTGNPEISSSTVRFSSLMLRSASKVFDRMLSTEMMEKQENEIIIHAKDIADVEHLLYFVVTNRLKATANALSIILLAHYFEIDRLFYRCVDQIVEGINVDNFVETVQIFNKFEIHEGLAAVVKFGKKHIKEIQQCDDFTELPHTFRCLALGVGRK